MKHTTKITAFLLVCLCLPLFSCSDGTVDTDDTSGTSGEEIDLGEPEYIYGTMDEIIYDNILYSKLGNSLRTRHIFCYDLSDLESESYRLIVDTLGETQEGEYELGSDGGFFLVDPWQTKKNNGNPVVIMSNMYFDKVAESMYIRLVSYDTSTNKTTLIKDEIDMSGFQDLCLYGDTVFYAVNEGRDGYNVYRVDINGENYMKMENRYRRAYFIYGMYDDRIYLLDINSGGIYSNSFDFDDEQYHFKVYPMAEVHVYDGYIYYASTPADGVEFDGRTHPSLTICRRPLSNMTQEEVVLENVYIGRYCKDKIYVQYVDVSVDPELNNVPLSALYEYSVETKEQREIYDMTETKAERGISAVSENYLVCYEYERDEDGQKLYYHLISINLATGEETVLREEE